MADLVIDEWLWADLEGQNTIEAQVEATQFLLAIFNKCDRLITVKGAKFERKAYDFFRHTDVTKRGISKIFNNLFRFNSNKSEWIEVPELADLPEPLDKRINPDDHYLVRAYLTRKAEVIVTTDTRLMEALTESGIVYKHRNEFVPDYVLRYGKK